MTEEREADIRELIGRTIYCVIGAEYGSDCIEFDCTDGFAFIMRHDKDCCERVEVEDVCGNVRDLIGYPITLAEDISSDCNRGALNDNDESYAWTWYKLATVKGYVTIRWYGESNGCYSERVDCYQVTPYDIKDILSYVKGKTVDEIKDMFGDDFDEETKQVYDGCGLYKLSFNDFERCDGANLVKYTGPDIINRGE